MKNIVPIISMTIDPITIKYAYSHIIVIIIIMVDSDACCMRVTGKIMG